MKNFSDIPPLDAASVLKCFHIRADKSLGPEFFTGHFRSGKYRPRCRDPGG